MATAQQIKSLLESHLQDDRERFATIALQVAAHEAKKGHSALANDIRNIVENIQKNHSTQKHASIVDKRLGELVRISPDVHRIPELVVNQELRARLLQVVKEFRQRDKIRKHGLVQRRKLLLIGPPGTGKTLTAKVLAGELHLPMYTVAIDKVVTKYLGETSAKMRQVFDLISNQTGVYLFDEFDAIGANRERDNDVGEMRRVVNSFLQFIEEERGDSIIVAATNIRKILDHALYRRFDDVLRYSQPTASESLQLMKNRLSTFRPVRFGPKSVAPLQTLASSMNHADIAMSCDNAIKNCILNDKSKVTIARLEECLLERKAVYEDEEELS